MPFASWLYRIAYNEMLSQLKLPKLYKANSRNDPLNPILEIYAYSWPEKVYRDDSILRFVCLHSVDENLVLIQILLKK